ncbi:hypothetical protein K431DRAFT_303955 [Polychaeton citri CBS 116435]|uniref:ER lumen protein-retaining receptor n=1 Tax=Polychaeton citri CBS 116435 TaxID=1314669 RepID=A0A9P4Q9Y3_9PEZI|nr:hypothetical protein K431DRAFT_303955 [Polychaeton citri CBS 116435]
MPDLFQIIADLSHTSSKLILIFAIHRNRSAEGVSLLTQLLYVLVFITRYLDLLSPRAWANAYLVFYKLLYFTTSFYVIYIMMRVYPRTREKEQAWKLAIWSLIGCTLLAPLVMLSMTSTWSFMELFWDFSQILESVCILPQLLLLRQTSVPTVIDSYYLLTLGIYRMIYIIHWIWGYATGSPPITVSVVFGIVQTALYADFAWVYLTRQRVKLRGGVVVDSDDMSKGFLVRRIVGRVGRHSQDGLGDGSDEDGDALSRQENGTIRPTAPNSSNRWGVRGISVSADDTLHDYQARKTNGQPNRGTGEYADIEAERDAQMMDPSHFEDDDDVDAPPPPPPAKDAPSRAVPEVEGDSSAGEWQSNAPK